MNKSNAAQFLPLVQALADGKTIQRRFVTTTKWSDYENPDFTLNFDQYRVKPEPREFVGRIIGTGRNYGDGVRHFDLEMDDAGGDLPELGKAIRLIEILD